MAVTEVQVLEALKSVQDPDLHRDIVSLGFVKDIAIDGGRVTFTVELTTPACPVKDQLQEQCRVVVGGLPGVEEVQVDMTAVVRTRSTEQEDLIPGVKHTIAIASGKGGVGKSTVTVNLAIALAEKGAKVGLLDADVYGPSIPLMMGAADQRPITQAGKIIPLEKYGIKMMSLGFLLEEGQAVLWRGPMVAGTVRQLLADVAWLDLDYLLVDLPPGTGDAPMSLAQLVPLTGVVIVTTPHSVAANIAGKSVQLFRRLNTNIMGVVENMGPFTDPLTGIETRIFFGRTGEELARELDVPYLGSIPLEPSISRAGDEGLPVVISQGGSPEAQAFREIAGKVAQQASILTVPRPEPANA